MKLKGGEDAEGFLHSVDPKTGNILISNFYLLGDDPLKVTPLKKILLSDLRHMAVKDL